MYTPIHIYMYETVGMVVFWSACVCDTFGVFHLCLLWLQHRYYGAVGQCRSDTGYDLRKFKHLLVPVLEHLLQKNWFNLVALLVFQAVLQKHLVLSLFLCFWSVMENQ